MKCDINSECRWRPRKGMSVHTHTHTHMRTDTSSQIHLSNTLVYAMVGEHRGEAFTLGLTSFMLASRGDERKKQALSLVSVSAYISHENIPAPSLIFKDRNYGWNMTSKSALRWWCGKTRSFRKEPKRWELPHAGSERWKGGACQVCCYGFHLWKWGKRQGRVHRNNRFFSTSESELMGW